MWFGYQQVTLDHSAVEMETVNWLASWRESKTQNLLWDGEQTSRAMNFWQDFWFLLMQLSKMMRKVDLKNDYLYIKSLDKSILYLDT